MLSFVDWWMFGDFIYITEFRAKYKQTKKKRELR